MTPYKPLFEERREQFIIIRAKNSAGKALLTLERVLVFYNYQPALTHVAHFSFVACILTQADEVIPGLDASTFMLTWIWSASVHKGDYYR